MKRIPLIILTLLVCLSAASCSAKVEQDVTCAELGAAVEAAIADADNLSEMGVNSIGFLLNVDVNADNIIEYTVKAPSGSSSIDEYGIFKMSDNKAVSDIAKTLNAYLETRVTTWDTRYDQSEKSKVDDAQIKIYGNYVLYLILDKLEAANAVQNVYDVLYS
jgi:hypothetical protein